MSMNINNTNAITKTTSVKPMGAKQKIYDTQLKQDTFEIKFNEQEAREFLDSKMDYNEYPEVPQYNDKQKDFILQTMSKNPKLWTPFKALADVPDIKGEDVVKCLKNAKKRKILLI